MLKIQAAARMPTAAFVVRVPAEIDIDNQDELRAALEAASAHATVVIADLTGTTFCDSSGVAALHWARTKLQDKGGELRIACDAQLRRFIVVTAYDHLFKTFATVPEALLGARDLRVPEIGQRDISRRCSTQRLEAQAARLHHVVRPGRRAR